MTRRKKTRPRGRGYTIALVVEALRVLSGLRLRVVELADNLGISCRSTYRLLDTLQELGLPLRCEQEGREVRYWLNRKEAATWLTAAQLRGPKS